MVQPIGKKRIHELDNFSGDLKGAVVLLSKEEKEYKIDIAELQGGGGDGTGLLLRDPYSRAI